MVQRLCPWAAVISAGSHASSQSVQVTGDLKKGVLAAMLRQLNIDRKEF